MENIKPKHIFKVLFIGKANAGKTTYLQRYLNGKFNYCHISTSEVESTQLTFNTYSEEIIFDVYDCPNNQKFKNIKDYYNEADIVFLFNDLTDMSSSVDVYEWIQSIKNVKNIPIIHIRNKCDISLTSHKPTYIFHKKYFNFSLDISVKNLTNFYTPFLYESRLLLNDTNLEFIPSMTVISSSISNSDESISNRLILVNQQEKKDDDDIEKIINNIKEKEKSIEKLKLQINYLQLVEKSIIFLNIARRFLL